MYTRIAPGGLLLLLAGVLAGCGSLRSGGDENESGGRRLLDATSAASFETSILVLRRQFQAEVESAAELIVERTKERRVRLEATRWKMAMVQASRDALRQPQILLAFESLYMLGFQMRDDLTEGYGKDAFGAHQSIAVAAAERFLTRVYDALDDHTKQGAKELAALVEAAAAEAPLGRGFTRPAFEGGSHVKKASMVSRATAVSLDVLAAPFRPFDVGRGIDAAATALDNFTTVAARFEDTARHIPEDARWQLELLLYRLDGLESLQRAVASIERVAENSASLTRVAETLPAKVAENARTVLADVEAQQAGLRETLDATRSAVAEMKGVMSDAAEVSSGLAAAGTAWDGAIVSFDRMADKFRTPESATPRPPGEGPGRPFDIREYTETARHLAEAAGELRALTVEVDRVAKDDALTGRIDDVERGAVATIDHAAWRAFQLILTIFVAALLFTLIRIKLIERRRAEGTGATRT